MKNHYPKTFFLLLFFSLFASSHFNALAADSEKNTQSLPAITHLLLNNGSPECDPTKLVIDYSGNSVSVNNPYENAGVLVEVDGADVTVISSNSEVEYCLTGTASDGMFKMYSESNFTLQLNGVELANSDGPAINIQSDKTASVVLMSGTTSTLTDGETYAEAPNEEDQKAAFFSEGQQVFSGSGRLFINGQGDDQHALASDDSIVVNSGTIRITDSVKDGIHTKDGYSQQAGSVQVSSGGDGIDAGDGPVEVAGGTLTVLIENSDDDGIKSDGELTISGGAVNLTINGDQSKGLKAAGDIKLTGGTIRIQTAGGVVFEESGSGYDPSYCTAIKTDNDIELDGAKVSITTTGEAGRGISADGDVRILSGKMTIASSGDGGAYTDEIGELDSYHGPCMKVDGSLSIEDGILTLSHSGTGGRGISVDTDLTIGTTTSSPTVEVTTSGQEISLGADDATEAKAIKVDNQITIDNGDITITSADDGIKSEVGIEINGGVINILDAVEGIEAVSLVINDGEIHISTSDDGMNTTVGGGTESDDDGSELIINGGYIYISASAGDCMDSNGTLTIAGGTIILHGPPSLMPPEGSLDANGVIAITGGYIVAAEVISPVSETPDSLIDSQNTVILNYISGGPGGRPGTSTISAGTLFHVQDSEGSNLLTFAPEREYSKILISSPDISNGTTYQVYTEGSSTGTEKDGLYINGSYSGGTLLTSFTSSGVVQQVDIGR